MNAVIRYLGILSVVVISFLGILAVSGVLSSSDFWTNTVKVLELAGILLVSSVAILLLSRSKK